MATLTEKIEKYKLGHDNLHPMKYKIFKKRFIGLKLRFKDNIQELILINSIRPKIAELFDKEGDYCFYCKKVLDYNNYKNRIDLLPSLEHKIPLCRGGDNLIENLTISCWKCNKLKGRKTAEEFFLTL